MAGFTPYFGIAFFDVDNNLADLNNVQREMERFVIIDKQLYGLYSVFGNGVIDGWVVSTPETQDATNISVDIGAGSGIINFFASETLYQDSVDSLPPNRTQYILARNTGLTGLDRGVQFIKSNLSTVANAILLAKVTTGNGGIVSIDNTVRTEIGFKSLIQSLVNSHHHRGSPTKIDLVNETQNQLPGSKIGQLPAELVTTGQFDSARLPAIDHNTLSNRGLFNHASLDTMSRKLSGTVDQLFGSIHTINRLKDLIFMKTQFSTYDKDWVNTFCLLPGITPDAFIDFSASDANINTGSHCISGLTAPTGQNINVIWNDPISFNTYYSISNAVVGSPGVTIARSDQITQLIEGFQAASDGTVLSSFVASVQQINSDTEVIATTATHTNDDTYAGQFHMEQNVRVIFTKTLNVTQDWSAFTNILISVKCSNITHGPVYFYFVDASGVQSSVYQLLTANEVTTNVDSTMNNFEVRSFSISPFTRTAVSKFVIYADDVNNDTDFYIDDIRLSRSQQYYTQGSIRLRYASTDSVVFNSLTFTSTLPTGTAVKARMRVADNSTDLNNALFTSYVPSSAGFNIRGKQAEIEVLLLSNTSQTLAPTLTTLELSFTANSTNNGITVQSNTNFNKGTLSNLTVTGTSTANVKITSPITLGDISFLNNSVVNEINSSKVPVFAINGSTLPPSEVQAFASLGSISSTGLLSPRSAVRTADRRWIVCDTLNNRILIFKSDGSLVAGYCGQDQDADILTDEAVGLTVTYNPNTGVLWLGFSKSLTIPVANFAKISLVIGSQLIVLSDEIAGASNVTGRVVGIKLTDNHQSLLNNNASTIVLRYGVGLSTGFNDQYANRDIKVYSANFTYFSNIFNPVYAVEKNDGSGRLWICNSTKPSGTIDSNGNTTYPPVPSVKTLYLFDPLVDTGISTKSVYFSQDFGGSIFEQNDGKLVVAGCDASRNGQVVLDPFGSPSVIYRSPTNNQPSDILQDSDGNYWLAESSSTSRAGRIIKIDSFGNVLSNISGAYTKVNNIQLLNNNNLLVSV